jgi:hypothetical protein
MQRVETFVPVDPDTNDGIALTETDCEPADTYNTSYQISQDASGRVTVAAPDAETVRGTTPVISVTR